MAQVFQYEVVLNNNKIMWLTVARLNNYPDIIFNFYLNCVAGLEGCPVKLRTDCGTENGVMAAMQCTFQQDAEAHKYGSSLVNQRIEGWWVFCKRNSCFKASRKRLEHERSAWVLELPLKCFTTNRTLSRLLYSFYNKESIYPLTPLSDQDRISPNNISTISTRQVMRLKKSY